MRKAATYIDPYWPNVSFLHGWNDRGTGYATFGAADKIDESQYAHASTGGSAATSVNEKAGGKFGDYLDFENAGGRLEYGDHAAFDFGSGPFTIETWVRFVTAPTSGLHYLINQYDTGANQRAWTLRVSAGSLEMALTPDGSTITIVAASAWAPTTGVWYHIAGDFDGTAYRTYVDGVMKGKSTTLVTPVHNSTAPMTVGAALNSGASNGVFRGGIDETRITKGVARYASDSGYTVPTAPFPRG